MSQRQHGDTSPRGTSTKDRNEPKMPGDITQKERKAQPRRQKGRLQVVKVLRKKWAKELN